MMSTSRRRRFWNMFFLWSIGVCAAVAIVPLALFLRSVLWNGFQYVSWSVLTELPMPVGETGGGIFNALMGTVVMVGIAMPVGIPMGILGGICLSEYGTGRLGRCLRITIDVLAGTPSIVIGMFVYLLLVVPFKQFSALAGGAALGIIMIPTIMRSTEAMLANVPKELREASLALGIPNWRTVVSVLLAAGRSGIATGVLLAVARVSGETAPLLFTAFGNRFWTTQVSQPMAALPHQIYTYAMSPYNDWQVQAWVGALLLTIAVLMLNLIARLLRWRF